jgi:hypothetical protein
MRFARDQTVVEPQHSETLPHKPSIPLGVSLNLQLMPIAVRLDDQAIAHANEIHDVASKRDLRAALEVAQTAISQQSPKCSFG